MKISLLPEITTACGLSSIFKTSGSRSSGGRRTANTRFGVKMAELGVISSSLGIVSLAIQVADSIMRLKNFLDSVREAPEEIKYIVRQIEALGMVLSGSDTEDDEEGLSEAVSVPMRNCKMFLSEAARGLETVLKELEEGIGKRKKMGSFKAVIKQGIIDRLRQRLRDAQDLLVLSNQYYSQ
jgi:hypothetical protein